MDAAGLHGELKRGTVRPVYLFVGDQDLLKEQALDALREKAGRGSVRRFHGPETTAADVIEAQRNGSLFDPIAVIVVRQASKLPRAEMDALAALGKESGGPPVVLWDVTVDRRLKFFDSIARAGGLVEFEAPRPRDAASFVGDEARRLGHRLGGDVPELLVEAVGTDLFKLRRALEVLSLAVGEGNAITAESVMRMIVEAREHMGWEIQDALAGGDGLRAVRLFRAALDEGQQLPLLVGVLYAQLRRLLLARDVPSGASPDETARRLSMPRFKVQELLQSARRFRVRELRSAVSRLADIDLAFKTGRGNAAAGLEEWILSVCRARGG